MRLLFILLLLFFRTNKDIATKEVDSIQENNNEVVQKKEATENTPQAKNEAIGYLSIPSININNALYNISNRHNNIEENVTIIRDSNNLNSDGSLLVLAAHSGTGKIAYFNNLNKLKIKDEINITYYNNKFIFTIVSIYEQDKNGYINISKDNKSTLILTTCSPENKDKQLIVESKLKES